MPSPRIPPQYGVIRRSRHTKHPKPLRKHSFVVLNVFGDPHTRPSPFRPAMETRGGGCATSPHRTPQPRDSAIPGFKVFRMVEEALLRKSAPFVSTWDPSIAFSPGDGRAGRGGPSPWISAPGAEGRSDQRNMTVQNLGEDSSPWFCAVI